MRRITSRDHLKEMKARRRRDSNMLANITLRSVRSTEFVSCVDLYLKGQRDGLKEEVKIAVAKLFLDTNITKENIANRTSAQQLWDEYLNPMFNTLRNYISYSMQIQPGKETQEFWKLLVVPEIQSHLKEVGLSSSNLMLNVKLVVEDQINING